MVNSCSCFCNGKQINNGNQIVMRTTIMVKNDILVNASAMVHMYGNAFLDFEINGNH